MTRPCVAVFLRGYLPGYRSGGPLQSIANLVSRLGDEFDFRIITADRDLGDTDPYVDTPPMRWLAVGKAQAIYLPPREQRLSTITRILCDLKHDAVYLNSFFDFQFATFPLIARRLGRTSSKPTVIVAPRGEFSPGALAIKPTKKRVFIAASRLVRLHSGVIWQASTEIEADDIRRTMHAHDIINATDLPRHPAPLLPRRDRAADDPLRIAFLSRISPKKNLLFCLETLAQVRSRVVFTIYGPREDREYWQRCEVAIAALPSHVAVVYGGPIEPRDVVPTLSQHEIFYLPTFGENYGHVIAEALEAGLRLLISDQTPWRGLSNASVGYDLPLDRPEAFVAAIDAEAGRADRLKDAERAYAHLANAFALDDVIDANHRLLSSAVSRAGG